MTTALNQLAQLGVEAWVSSPSFPDKDQVAQLGVEAWVSSPSFPDKDQVAQLGVEAWVSVRAPLPNQDVLTQLGIEAWVSSQVGAVASSGIQFFIYLDDIVALAPLQMPTSIIPTPQTVELTAAVNWTPLTDIAGSVTGAAREALAGTGRTVQATSLTVASRQLPKRTYRLGTLYRYEADAQLRANLLEQWLERGLKGFSVTINRYRNQVELGLVGRIESYPRFGLQNGFTGVVCGYKEVPAKGQVTLILIG